MDTYNIELLTNNHTEITYVKTQKVFHSLQQNNNVNNIISLGTLLNCCVIYEHLRICIVSDFKCFNELNMCNEMLISNCKLLNYVGTICI